LCVHTPQGYYNWDNSEDVSSGDCPLRMKNLHLQHFFCETHSLACQKYILNDDVFLNQVFCNYLSKTVFAVFAVVRQYLPTTKRKCIKIINYIYSHEQIINKW